MSRLSHSETHMVHRIGWLRAAVLGEGFLRQVAGQLTEKDALGAHARDALGISETVTAHPMQVAVVSEARLGEGSFLSADLATSFNFDGIL